jgi:hypothetical protein
MHGSCVVRAVRVRVLRGVQVWMCMGFANVRGCSFSLRIIVALCDETVLRAGFPRRRGHKWRRLRRGCGAYRRMRRDSTARATAVAAQWLF